MCLIRLYTVDLPPMIVKRLYTVDRRPIHNDLNTSVHNRSNPTMTEVDVLAPPHPNTHTHKHLPRPDFFALAAFAGGAAFAGVVFEESLRFCEVLGAIVSNYNESC